MGQRRQWDRDAESGPAWARNLVLRRAFLIEEQAAHDQPAAERILETSFPCAVGDLVAVPTSVLAAGGTWKIVAREAAPAPYVARLIVTPADPE